jgi:hypothetical protein
MAEPAYQFCVAPRKDGRPCRGMGQYFDPQRDGLVCDAHAGPEINTNLQQHMQTLERMARQQLAEATAEATRRRDALAIGLSDDGLPAVLKDFQKFREGQTAFA